MKRFRSVAAALLCIGMAAVIFTLSAADSTRSARTSEGITGIVVSLLFPDFSGKAPEEQAILLNRINHAVRKAAHFTEYFCFGFLLNCYTAAPATWTARLRKYRQFVLKFRIPLALALSGLYALSDEFHQYFVPGRGPALTDAAIDFAGACSGTLLFVLFSVFLNRISRKKPAQKVNYTIVKQ